MEHFDKSWNVLNPRGSAHTLDYFHGSHGIKIWEIHVKTQNLDLHSLPVKIGFRLELIAKEMFLVPADSPGLHSDISVKLHFQLDGEI